MKSKRKHHLFTIGELRVVIDWRSKRRREKKKKSVTDTKRG